MTWKHLLKEGNGVHKEREGFYVDDSDIYKITEQTLTINMKKDNIEILKELIEERSIPADIRARLRSVVLSELAEPIKDGRFDIFNYTLDKKFESRPALFGVYHDPSGVQVATDGHIMVWVKAEVSGVMSGKELRKDGEITELKYPDWKTCYEGYGRDAVVSVTLPSDAYRKVCDHLAEDVAKAKLNGMKKATKNTVESFVVVNGMFQTTKYAKLFLEGMLYLGTDVVKCNGRRHSWVAESEKGGILVMCYDSGVNPLVLA